MLKTLSGRNASQNEAELAAFVTLLCESGVRRYCEIGARHGDTFAEIMAALPVGAYGLAVDLPGGLWGTSKSAVALRRACAVLEGMGRKVECLFGDSHDRFIATAIYDRGPFDAVFIDADHSYEAVAADWRIYRSLAPIVAFHDIAGHGQIERVGGHPVEVPRLWAQIKSAGFATREFVDEGSAMGIGVVYTDAPVEASAVA